jgi:hypothetical protein
MYSLYKNEYRIFKLVEMKKNKEPVCLIVHIHMQTSQGNTPYSYFKQAKISFFSFFMYKFRDQ